MQVWKIAEVHESSNLKWELLSFVKEFVKFASRDEKHHTYNLD